MDQYSPLPTSKEVGALAALAACDHSDQLPPFNLDLHRRIRNPGGV